MSEKEPVDMLYALMTALSEKHGRRYLDRQAGVTMFQMVEEIEELYLSLPVAPPVETAAAS